MGRRMRFVLPRRRLSSSRSHFRSRPKETEGSTFSRASAIDESSFWRSESSIVMVIGVVIVAIDKPWYPEGSKNILPERTSRAQPQLPIYRENKSRR